MVLDRPTSPRLHDHLDRWARERPDAPFAVQEGRTLSWAQAAAVSRRMATALRGAGLRPGARCAVLSRNSVDHLLLYLAASRAGVVLVPLNPRCAPDEWRHVLTDAGAGMVVAAREHLAGMEELCDETPTVRRVVGFGDVGGLDGGRARRRPRPAQATGRAAGPDPHAAAYQIYTSGTTGAAKGAVLGQPAVTANIVQIAGGAHGGRAGERALVVSPLCHAGVVWAAFAPMAWGATLVVEPDFDPDRLMRTLREQRIGYASLVPAVLARLITLPAARHPDLRLVHTGSSPITTETLRRAGDVLGCDVVHGYGLTEATAGVSTMTPADNRWASGPDGDPSVLGSVGRPLPGTRVRIVDDRGAALPAGSVGEVVVQGPQLMSGYWGRPEATAGVLRDGWLHTGDAGLLDVHGFLHLRDRIKDVIVSGGENVYPAMVERVLAWHPGVAEAAVIGIPDPRWGETVHAVVVTRAGAAPTEEALIGHCRAHLGGFQRPRSVQFVRRLPRGASGKVLKRVLREPFWAGRDRQVAGV
jgi:acyl-CoA synthetase (AMP-forming)/AMP-acid ligase II